MILMSTDITINDNAFHEDDIEEGEIVDDDDDGDDIPVRNNGGNLKPPCYGLQENSGKLLSKLPDKRNAPRGRRRRGTRTPNGFSKFRENKFFGGTNKRPPRNNARKRSFPTTRSFSGRDLNRQKDDEDKELPYDKELKEYVRIRSKIRQDEKAPPICDIDMRVPMCPPPPMPPPFLLEHSGCSITPLEVVKPPNSNTSLLKRLVGSGSCGIRQLKVTEPIKCSEEQFAKRKEEERTEVPPLIDCSRFDFDSDPPPPGTEGDIILPDFAKEVQSHCDNDKQRSPSPPPVRAKVAFTLKSNKPVPLSPALCSDSDSKEDEEELSLRIEALKSAMIKKSAKWRLRRVARRESTVDDSLADIVNGEIFTRWGPPLENVPCLDQVSVCSSDHSHISEKTVPTGASDEVVLKDNVPSKDSIESSSSDSKKRGSSEYSQSKSNNHSKRSRILPADDSCPDKLSDSWEMKSDEKSSGSNDSIVTSNESGELKSRQSPEIDLLEEQRLRKLALQSFQSKRNTIPVVKASQPIEEPAVNSKTVNSVQKVTDEKSKEAASENWDELDEDILRADLLRKLVRTVPSISENSGSESPVATVSTAVSKPDIEKQCQEWSEKMVPRFVISLQSDEETSSSDTDAENCVKYLERSVDKLLLEARIKSDQRKSKEFKRPIKTPPRHKTGAVSATPMAVRHLPEERQKEYRRLKMMLAEKEKLRLKTAATSEKKLAHVDKNIEMIPSKVNAPTSIQSQELSTSRLSVDGSVKLSECLELLGDSSLPSKGTYSQKVTIVKESVLGDESCDVGIGKSENDIVSKAQSIKHITAISSCVPSNALVSCSYNEVPNSDGSYETCKSFERSESKILLSTCEDISEESDVQYVSGPHSVSLQDVTDCASICERVDSSDKNRDNCNDIEIVQTYRSDIVVVSDEENDISVNLVQEKIETLLTLRENVDEALSESTPSECVQSIRKILPNQHDVTSCLSHQDILVSQSDACQSISESDESVTKLTSHNALITSDSTHLSEDLSHECHVKIESCSDELYSPYDISNDADYSFPEGDLIIDESPQDDTEKALEATTAAETGIFSPSEHISATGNNVIGNHDNSNETSPCKIKQEEVTVDFPVCEDTETRSKLEGNVRMPKITVKKFATERKYESAELPASGPCDIKNEPSIPDPVSSGIIESDALSISSGDSISIVANAVPCKSLQKAELKVQSDSKSLAIYKRIHQAKVAAMGETILLEKVAVNCEKLRNMQTTAIKRLEAAKRELEEATSHADRIAALRATAAKTAARHYSLAGKALRVWEFLPSTSSDADMVTRNELMERLKTSLKRVTAKASSSPIVLVNSDGTDQNRTTTETMATASAVPSRRDDASSPAQNVVIPVGTRCKMPGSSPSPAQSVKSRSVNLTMNGKNLNLGIASRNSGSLSINHRSNNLGKHRLTKLVRDPRGFRSGVIQSPSEVVLNVIVNRKARNRRNRKRGKANKNDWQYSWSANRGTGGGGGGGVVAVGGGGRGGGGAIAVNSLGGGNNPSAVPRKVIEVGDSSAAINHQAKHQCLPPVLSKRSGAIKGKGDCWGDPDAVVCPYDLGGTCRDLSCTYKHINR